MGRIGRYAVNATQWIGAKRAGMQLLSVEVEGRVTKYYTGGAGSPLVLLHGLGDDKSSFVSAARELTKEHTVFLPDLPGHGDSGFYEAADHTIKGLADWTVAFLNAVGLTKVDLGGNSMGGHIALAVAIRHPERIERLILVNAPGAGMASNDVYTGFGEELRSRADLEKLLGRVVHRAPSLPGVVATHMIEVVNKGMPNVNNIARTLREEDCRFDDRLATVRAPTLILWGIHDVVLKRSIATAYREGLPNSKLIELDAGHSPQLEAAGKVGTAINEFLRAPRPAQAN